jgi:hypothetical protein
MKSRWSLGNIFKNFNSTTLKTIEEMNKFLDTRDLPKLNQEDTNHLNDL